MAKLMLFTAFLSAIVGLVNYEVDLALNYTIAVSFIVFLITTVRVLTH